MTDARVALVTGASRGIGRAIALRLAEAGFDIAALARPHSREAGPCSLDGVRAEIESKRRRCLAVHADVADLDHHGEIVAKVYSEFGRLDVFVSNAGIAPNPRVDVL